MSHSTLRSFLPTLAYSGFLYIASYMLVAKSHQELQAGLAFIIGAGVYTILYLAFKTDEALIRLISKAYVFCTLLVPFALIIIYLLAFLFSSPELPEFQSAISFESLEWAGIFAVVFWPLANIYILIENALTLATLILYYLSVPIAAVAVFFISGSIITLMSEIKQLESSLSEGTSISVLIGCAVTSLTFFTVVAYFVS